MRAFLWVVLAIVSIPSSALTLDEALQEALSSHPGLRAQEIRQQVLSRDKASSYQAFFPTLTAGFGAQRWNDTSNFRQLVGLTPQFSGSTLTGLTPTVYEPDPLSWGGKVDLTFTLGIAAVSSMMMADAQWEEGAVQVDQVRLGLVAGVQKAFAGVLALKTALDVAVQQEVTAKDRWVFVEAGRAQGTQAEADSLQAHSLWSERTIDRVRAESRLADGRRTLAALLGRSEDNFTLEGDLAHPPGDDVAAGDLMNKYLARRPELRDLTAQGHALDAQVWGAVALAVPQVVLEWTADPATNAGSAWKQTNGALAVQLQWKLDSLLPGSKFWTLKEDLADYQAGLIQAKRQAALTAQTEVARLAGQVNDARRIIPLREQQVEEATRAASLSQLAFQAGIRRLIDAQETDDLAARARLGLAQEQLQLASALADLEQALSLSLEELHAK